jgi:hypothetical protein
MKSTIVLVLSVFLSTFAGSAPAAVSRQANLSPVALGTANDSNFDGQWDTHYHTCCLAYNGLPSTYNFRTAVEFDLSFIPAADSLLSATFYIRYDGANGLPANQLQFNSYAGNGAVDFDDFEEINQIALLNNFGPGDGTLWYKVPATAAAKSILDQNGDYLGLMIQNTEWGQTALLDPYLSVTFVPEPGASTVLSIAALLSMSWTRKLRRQTSWMTTRQRD